MRNDWSIDYKLDIYSIGIHVVIKEKLEKI